MDFGYPDTGTVECMIAAAMRRAETDWRKSLVAQTLADIQSTVDGKTPHAGPRMRKWLAAA